MVATWKNIIILENIRSNLDEATIIRFVVNYLPGKFTKLKQTILFNQWVDSTPMSWYSYIMYTAQCSTWFTYGVYIAHWFYLEKREKCSRAYQHKEGACWCESGESPIIHLRLSPHCSQSLTDYINILLHVGREPDWLIVRTGWMQRLRQNCRWKRSKFSKFLCHCLRSLEVAIWISV